MGFEVVEEVLFGDNTRQKTATGHKDVPQTQGHEHVNEPVDTCLLIHLQMRVERELARQFRSAA